MAITEQEDSRRSPGPGGQSNDLIEITPGDSGEGLANGEVPPSTGLYIESGGVLSYINAYGKAREVEVFPGDFDVMNIQRINATNTTATGIYAYVDADYQAP